MAQAQDDVLSHWSTLIENFQTSPLAFSQAVEEALARRQVPQTQNTRVDYREAGVLSANREYLHVTREKLVFDICGAPFGTGFFVSWWLAEERPHLNPLLKILVIFGMLGVTGAILSQLGSVLGLIVLALLVFGGLAVVNTMATNGDFNDNIVRALPILGPLYVWLFTPSTYYRIDTMQMFQKAVHNSVLEVIDTMTADKGIRALSESDRKPIMREFYAKGR
ncbi:MAG: hypothetical protein ABL986_08005 [Vicinamibacterales bacterium]